MSRRTLLLLCSVALALAGGARAFGGAQALQQGEGCPAGGRVVADAASLRLALATAEPGDVIALADGVYTGAFTIRRAGTALEPISLCGSHDAVLDGENAVNYVLHVNGAKWWHLNGFAVRKGRKGIVADRAKRVLFSHLLVTETAEEAIHLRTFSSDNRLIANTVRDTGRERPEFGEGIYIGSAQGNWCRYTNCRPDRSDRNAVVGNVISHTTAESIDIKEGTTGGVISGNRVYGVGMTYADSWLELKGNGWLVQRNTGRLSPGDGIQTYVVHGGWGRRNAVRANRLVVNGPGYGIYVHRKERSLNVIRCDNVVIGARKGFSNIRCRRT